jgi:hypothetical protein
VENFLRFVSFSEVGFSGAEEDFSGSKTLVCLPDVAWAVALC